jgi:hypothetical protein
MCGDRGEWFLIFRHPDESRGPDFGYVRWLQVWVPAFAWMTEILFSRQLRACLCKCLDPLKLLADAFDAAEMRHGNAPAPGIVDLRHKADIRKRG